MCTRILLLEKGYIIKDIPAQDAGSRRQLEEYFDITDKTYE